MKKNILKKGSRVKVISGSNKGFVGFIVNINRKKKFVNIENLKRKISLFSKNYTKYNKNPENFIFFIPVDFSNVSIFEEKSS